VKKNILNNIVSAKTRADSEQVLTREPSISKVRTLKGYKEVVDLAKGSFGTVKLVKVNTGTKDVPGKLLSH
jgi:hypothetical protein